jgi:hypothetical protein
LENSSLIELGEEDICPDGGRIGSRGLLPAGGVADMEARAGQAHVATVVVTEVETITRQAEVIQGATHTTWQIMIRMDCINIDIKAY